MPSARFKRWLPFHANVDLGFWGFRLNSDTTWKNRIPGQAGNEGVGTKIKQTSGYKKTAAVQSVGAYIVILWGVKASYRPLTY
jgi:hypothetical protein